MDFGVIYHRLFAKGVSLQKTLTMSSEWRVKKTDTVSGSRIIVYHELVRIDDYVEREIPHLPKLTEEIFGSCVATCSSNSCLQAYPIWAFPYELEQP